MRYVKLIVFIVLGLLLLYSISVVVVTGAFKKNQYQDVYQEGNIEKYDDLRLKVISYGMLAPSSHNIQPWSVELNDEDDNSFSVYLDESRTLMEVDNNYNQMFISLGVFLSYVEVGAHNNGFDIAVEYHDIDEDNLFESPIYTVTMNSSNDSFDEVSFDAVSSATVRLPYNNSEISDGVINDLRKYNKESTMVEYYSEDSQVVKLRQTLIEGVQVESKTKSVMLETSNVFRYTKTDKNLNSYGLTMHSNTPNNILRTNLEFLGKIFPLTWEQQGEIWLENEKKNINSTNVFGMIYGGLSRQDQLDVGYQFGKINLECNEYGVSLQPIVQLTQSYEEILSYTDAFQEDYKKDGKYIYIVFRIGYNDEKVQKGIRLSMDDVIR